MTKSAKPECCRKSPGTRGHNSWRSPEESRKNGTAMGSRPAGENERKDKIRGNSHRRAKRAWRRGSRLMTDQCSRSCWVTGAAAHAHHPGRRVSWTEVWTWGRVAECRFQGIPARSQRRSWWLVGTGGWAMEATEHPAGSEWVRAVVPGMRNRHDVPYEVHVYCTVLPRLPYTTCYSRLQTRNIGQYKR